jgi:hypothetical protein
MGSDKGVDKLGIVGQLVVNDAVEGLDTVAGSVKHGLDCAAYR